MPTLTHPLPAGKLPLPRRHHTLLPSKGRPPKPPCLCQPWGHPTRDTQGTPHRPYVPSTHIFEGENDNSDDPSHHEHDGQHAEEPRTRREINLPGTHTYTFVTGEPGVFPPPS